MNDRFAPGLKDEEFARADVPMTKREVRAVTLAYARVAADAAVLDIGAGTGGLTVEFARACPRGRVVALERDESALSVLGQNVGRLAPGNVEIVDGEAPEALAGIRGHFDAVVVGGHGGRLGDVLEAASALLAPGGRVVVNAVGLGALTAALEALSLAPWTEPECCQVSVSRAERLGADLRFVPLNPVFVLAARLDQEAAR